MENIRQYYSLSYNTIKLLNNHTVDIFPTEVAITEPYGFNWHPRPVFQSYSAYTTYLDSINAKHFSSDSAPKYVLFSLKILDFRYPIFDEPATFRELLKEYEICGGDKDFIILQKKDKVAHYLEVPIHQTKAGFSQAITLPNIDDGLLFAKIHVEYNLLGRIAKVLFRTPQVFFAFLNNGETTAIHRFIISNAENGIFLSQYINGNYSLARVWQNEIRKNITQIGILTEHPAFFKRQITVEFFKLTVEQ
jgi:hypothetical protein